VRVLTFIHSFEPGGVERIALRLVRYWREQGMEAPLLVGRPSGAMAANVAQGLDFMCPPQPRFGSAAIETLWMIKTLPAVIRAVRPQVLFCPGNSYTIVAVALKILLRKRCPPIMVKISNDLRRADMLWPIRKLYHRWLRLQGRCLDRFIAMDPAMAAEAIAFLRPPAGAVSVIPPPALSLPQIAALRATAPARDAMRKGRRFVAIGRLAAQKNLALMVRAFAEGAAPEDSLTILGEGPERARLAKLAHRLGLSDRVQFCGHVPDAARAMKAFDIFMLSSDYEGMPAVVIEALAADLPIIATNCSTAMAALLGEGRLGTLVPVGDQRALASAIAHTGALPRDSRFSLIQARRFAIDRAGKAYLREMAGLSGASTRLQKVSPDRLRRSARRDVSLDETAFEGADGGTDPARNYDPAAAAIGRRRRGA
jgi:glycosyltransferase involved in cell wall biosynthesis